MRKIFGIILIFFLFGCGHKTPINQIPLRSSEPIFLDEKPKNNKIFIDVMDENGRNLELKSFFENKISDFTPTNSQNLAGVLIKIYLSNINLQKEKEFFIDPFDCSPFFGCRYDPLDYKTNYIYDGEASLQIKIQGKNSQITQQNLTFKNRLNYNKDEIKIAFLNSIANKINLYLQDLKDKK